MNETIRTLQTTSLFNRSLKNHVGRDKKRLYCVIETLLRLVENPRDPMLETHALRGAKKGMLSCSCGYDCRIIFRIELGTKPNTENIFLLNVGTHDDVY